MDIYEYQVLAASFSKYPKDVEVMALALGLVNEAGEVAGKVKKVLRGDKSLADQKQAILDECGDTLWYLSNLIRALGSDLETEAGHNYTKLADRQARGVIQGDGDKR